MARSSHRFARSTAGFVARAPKQVLGRLAYKGDRGPGVPGRGPAVAGRQSGRRIRSAQGAWRPGSRARGVRGATRLEPAPCCSRADVSGLARRARWARIVGRAPCGVLRGVREGRRPRQGQPLRRRAPGAHADRLRNARATEALPAEDPRRHGTVVPGLLGTRCGQRPRQRVDGRGAGRRRMGDQRAEGVDVAGALGAVVLRRRAHGDGVEASRTASPTCWCHSISRVSTCARSSS